MLNKRSVEILKGLIDKDNTISLEELAEKYKLSKRSIRYDIDNINFFLKVNKYKELEKKSRGVYILDETRDNCKGIMNLIKNSYYVFSPVEREDYIKASLYFPSKSLKLGVLEKTFSISNSTARNDLGNVKSYYEKKGLKIDYQPKKGFVLSGDEEILRKAALKFLFKYVRVSGKKIVCRDRLTPTLGIELVVDVIGEYFKNTKVDRVSKFIKVVAKALNVNISDEATKLLRLYLLILINRVYNFHFLEDRVENEVFLSETKEYEILKERIEELEEEFSITLNNSELLFLTDLLLGSHSYNFNTSFFKNWIELEHLVKKMIQEVGEQLGVDLSGDMELHRGVINHLKPSLYRIKNDITLENKMAKEVKEQFTRYFNAVGVSCEKNLESHIGKKVPDEEVGYLTIHFKMAIDRKAISTKPKNVILVCSFGYGSTQLLAQQLNEEFNVNIVKILPYHEFADINEFVEVDFIITTLNTLEKKADIPVVKVSPLLSEESKEELIKLGIHRKSETISLSKILTIIEEYERTKSKNNLVHDLKKLLPINLIDDRGLMDKKSLRSFLGRESIEYIGSVDGWREGILKSGKLLIDKGCITEEYVDRMIEIIEKNGSYMVINDNIAIPHASTSKCVNKTGFSLLFLDEEVEFPEGKMVKLIIAFASINQDDHSRALTDLIDLIEDHSFLNYLENYPSKDDVLEFIENKVC